MLGELESILVTGGAGFVGSWLVEELLRRSDRARVAVADNLFNGCRDHIADSSRVSFHEVDLTESRAVEAMVDEVRPQAVFHLAALHYIPYCDAHPAETMQVNVVGTQNLLEALRRAEPKVLVAASTVAVYPIRDEPNSEDDPTAPVDIYGLSKSINERQVELFSRQVSTRCAMARLSNVYGPRETNPHVIPEILDQLAAGRGEIALGNVKPKRDYIYVTDVASGLSTIAERNRRPYRVYNLGTGEEYSVEEIVGFLSRLTGRRIEIGVATSRVRKVDRMHLVSDIRRITGELGWRPELSIQSGLAALVQDVGLVAGARVVGPVRVD